MDIPTAKYKEKMRNDGRSAPLLFVPTATLIFLAFLLSAPLYGQIEKDTLILYVMGCSAESLFNCRRNTPKNDYEFLSDAVRHQNYFKYKKKLDAITRVIVAVGKWTPPTLVVLYEVENDNALHDLTRYSILQETGYRYVIIHSPGERGIDVVSLY